MPKTAEMINAVWLIIPIDFRAEDFGLGPLLGRLEKGIEKTGIYDCIVIEQENPVVGFFECPRDPHIVSARKAQVLFGLKNGDGWKLRADEGHRIVGGAVVDDNRGEVAVGDLL